METKKSGFSKFWFALVTLKVVGGLEIGKHDQRAV